MIKKERSVAPFTRRRAVQIGAAGSFVAAATSAARRFALASKMERVSSFEKSLNESHTQSCKVNFEAGSKEHTAWARKEKYALYLPKRTSGEMGESWNELINGDWSGVMLSEDRGDTFRMTSFPPNYNGFLYFF